jgi:transposase
MMGRQSSGQDRLFYSFNLEAHVPQDHLLRSIDRHLDLSNLRHRLESYYSQTGRPSVDPELMIRMLIVGYSYGIRSERRLCDEVHLNLAYRWFCRLSLEDGVPNHSTFSKNRHGRFRASGAFRLLFDDIVRQCMSAGLVKGSGFAVDASIIAADANKQHSVAAGEAIDWASVSTRVVREYLEALDDEAIAEAHVAERSAVALDRSGRWPGVLRLLDQLPDRRRARRDHGRRGDACIPHR